MPKETGVDPNESSGFSRFPLSLPADPFFGQRYVQVLGRGKLFHAVPYPGGAAELDFFVEGLRFPDETFSGLVSIHVSLLERLAEVWERAGAGARGRLPHGERDGELVPLADPKGGGCLGGTVWGTPPISPSGHPALAGLHGHRGVPGGAVDHGAQHAGPGEPLRVQVRVVLPQPRRSRGGAGSGEFPPFPSFPPA